MPKVSVIVSTYNRPERLRRCIDSILEQTYPNIEIIVCDDASNKKTRKVLSAYQDKGIIYVRLSKHTGNHGAVKNEGIKIATGEFIKFVDDDNTIRPDHLNVLVKALDANPDVAVVYGDRWVHDEATGKADIGYFSDFNPPLLFQRNYIDTSDMLVRREALEYLGGWDERYKRFLDWNLVIRMLKAGMTFLRVPQVITDYYFHSGSISNQAPKEMWDVYDCEIRLPYLGVTPPEPKVAVFSITYDRLDYTKKSFEGLHKTAGHPFSHFVVDNGSTDGTTEWLEEKWKHSWTGMLTLNTENKGISIASNQAIDKIGQDYDIIVKFDNDCMCLTDGWLAKMVEIYKSNHMLALSPYVQGLKDNPGGAPRIGYGKIRGEMLGITKHLGGICHFVNARAYANFRWPEDEQYHGLQDLEFSHYLISQGYQMGYLENYFVSHGPLGTEAQYKDYPEYFERRKKEKVERPTRDYQTIQEQESAMSRGTVWGERILDSVQRYRSHFKPGVVLDLGCGDGLGMDIIAELTGNSVRGVDIAVEKLKIAEENGNVVSNAPMESIPYPDKYFSTVFCSHTLEHAQDKLKAAGEIARVASRAIIIVPIEQATTNPAHTSPFTDPSEVKALFPNATIVHEEELARLEREYVLIIDL